jgi:RHS repeat-associated protein
MAYDAENRLVNFNSGAGQYSYDGDGRRVKKTDTSGTTIFVYNVAGQLIAEYTSGTPSGGGTSYLTSDHLGSTRVVTKSDGTVKARYDYLPFGEEIEPSKGGRSGVIGYGGADSTRQKFTQKERDSESGLDYFLARYYSSAQGRFTSPDKPLFGQDKDNPQTWNLYAYTSNNPLNRIDPGGERWFYKKNDDGKITDARWVNANDDGSYTSPGEGWTEFVPTEGHRVLTVYSADGRTAYNFWETSADGPGANANQTGKVEDASIGLVADYLLAKAFSAVVGRAVSAFSGFLSRKATEAAAKEAFETASAGGRHSGFLQNYVTRSKEEIRRAIKSIEKQIAKHEGKISNPEEHVKDWQRLDPRQQDALVNRKWPGDIQRQKEQVGILKELVKRK